MMFNDITNFCFRLWVMIYYLLEWVVWWTWHTALLCCCNSAMRERSVSQMCTCNPASVYMYSLCANMFVLYSWLCPSHISCSKDYVWVWSLLYTTVTIPVAGSQVSSTVCSMYYSLLGTTLLELKFKMHISPSSVLKWVLGILSLRPLVLCVAHVCKALAQPMYVYVTY